MNSEDVIVYVQKSLDNNEVLTTISTKMGYSQFAMIAETYQCIVYRGY